MGLLSGPDEFLKQTVGTHLFGSMQAQADQRDSDKLKCGQWGVDTGGQ